MIDLTGISARPSPAVLPPCAARFTALFDADAGLFAGGPPPALTQAAPKRQRQFMAGRYCAVRALESLGGPAPALAILRGPAGEPLWPDGVTGSITHTGPLASAAVAWRSDVRSVGIDTEAIVSDAQCARLSHVVLQPSERAAGPAALAERVRFTLVFSAKESVFKCLYPLVGARFDYAAVAVTSIDLAAGSFVARLTTALAPALPEGRAIDGRFEIGDRYVHTGVWLPHVEPTQE